MVTNQSRRDFLASASSVVTTSALASLGGPGTLAQPASADLATFARTFADNRLGQVIRPGSPEHAGIKYYNGRFDCVRTMTFLRPATADAVVAIVEWARANRRTYAVRGSGHSFEGKSHHPDLVIDMSAMTKLDVKPDGTLDVEAGVVLGEVYKKLSPVERLLPGGTCPTVGLVGHALGGGLGDYTPMFGYAAQSLLEVSLVTHGGTHVRINDQSLTPLGGAPLPPATPRPAELMKILRGGGQGTLGIVTNMKFRTHDLRGAKLASFHLESTPELTLRQAVTMIRAWQTWRERLAPPLQSMASAKLNLSRNNTGYSIEMMGLIAIPADSSVPMARLRRTLDPLFTLAGLRGREFKQDLNTAATIATFLDDEETTHNPERKNLYGSSSALTAGLSQSALEVMLRNLPTTVYVSMYTSGGAVKTGPQTSLHPSEFLLEWSTYRPERDRAASQTLRRLRTDVMRASGLRDLGFPNYPDDESRNYFTNPDALAAARRVFDPGEVCTSSLVGAVAGRVVDGACR